jgi:hypothetical protein
MLFVKVMSLLGVIGRSRTRMPTAPNTAFPTAAATPVAPSSPIPFAPNGPNLASKFVYDTVRNLSLGTIKSSVAIFTFSSNAQIYLLDGFFPMC